MAGAPCALVGGILGWVGNSAQHSEDVGTFQSAQQTVVARVPELPSGVRLNWVGSGLFKTPSEMAPGGYIVTATGNTFGCAWETRKANDEKPKSVIDSGTVARGSLAQFSITPSTRVIRLIGDCTWEKM
jgi:hypothetical protein